MGGIEIKILVAVLLTGFLCLTTSVSAIIQSNTEKTDLEDYSSEAYQTHWMTNNPDIAKQLTPKQARELIVFRESNAENAKKIAGIGKLEYQQMVEAIDGVIEANLDGTIDASSLMNSSLAYLYAFAPDKCGNGSAIQILAENYQSWSHGGPHICRPCAMCWNPDFDYSHCDNT